MNKQTNKQKMNKETQCSRLPVEESNIPSASQEFPSPPRFYGTRMFITTSTRARHLSPPAQYIDWIPQNELHLFLPK